MITVYFRKGRHPYYDEIFNYPPSGVRYIAHDFYRGVMGTTHTKKYKLKKILFSIYSTLKGNVNAIPIHAREDLIFSVGGVMVNSKKPWVTDTEQGYALIGFKPWAKNIERKKRNTVNFIKRHNCKILPWSIAAKKSIQNLFGTHEIDEKLEVVYPAMHIEKTDERKKRSHTCTFLYVNRNFYGKAGLETIKAFDKISKKYDAKLVFISNTPVEIRKKFEANKDICFIEAPIPRRQVLQLYRKSDVFVLPTLFDCFGFAFLEAMAASLPVIATRIYAVPEIVEHEKTGLLVDTEIQMYNKKYMFAFPSTQHLYDYVKKHPPKLLERGLENHMTRLLENRQERIRFGKEGRKAVEKGKFSIKHRNKKLKKIFEELLRK